MIRYDIGLQALKNLISAEDADWLDDAAGLTERFRQSGDYLDHNTIWRRIVRVYMEIQRNKCAFCERKFEDQATGGTREFDVEHFRPKSSVKKWPPANLQDELPADFPEDSASTKGYFLLPYHPYNYTVACKPCNSSFKSNFFPIRSVRDIDGDDPLEMKGEKPFLVYPLGHFDSDPESIVEYDGILAVPRVKSGEKHLRGIAIIVFFRLNIREEHFLERAQKLAALFLALRESDSTQPLVRTTARALVSSLTSENSAHTNCMRSFKRLFESDRARAETIIRGVGELLETSS